MERISNYKKAAISLVDNVDINKNLSVESELKKITLAALDYAHRVSRGNGLIEEKKQLAGKFLITGALINDFYDVDILETEMYKEARKEFKTQAPERENDFQRYRKELSTLEKGRPIPSELLKNNCSRLEPIKKYREDLDKLSLAFSFAIAFDKPLSGYYENFGAQTVQERSLFKGFFNAVMALQVVDDLVGRGGDLAQDRPSFYTATCTEEEIQKHEVLAGNKETYKKMDKLFFGYFDEANRHSSEKLKPILNAVRFTKTVYPKLTELARKHPFIETATGLNILSSRDREDS